MFGPTRLDSVEAGELRRRALHDWFEKRRRSFPWRGELTPWGTFVAEMLLRRTRAEQVAKHLPAVLKRYPGPSDLAAATVAEVEDALRPFGLYWRARTLRSAASLLAQQFAAEIPRSIDELLELPGVGPYVAAATVAALSGEDVVLVDTNTVRVATRVAGLARRGDIRRRSDVRDAVRALLGGRAPAASWWAVLDLASAICSPKTPACPDCPIRDLCATGMGRE
jgi:A/G-specific adenine glycosylase